MMRSGTVMHRLPDALIELEGITRCFQEDC
jgi:hypothetical protein